MNDIDVAWAAGFLEGEGCFGWYGGGTRRRAKPHLTRTANAVINASQNEREPLDRLVSIFGAGRINPKRNKVRTAWEWRCQGHAAIPVMKAVLPHMSARRAERIREVIAEHNALQEQIATRKNAPTCKNGHPWSEFTGYRKKGVHAGKRYCKACSRESARRQQAKKRRAA
jgi:hypothetical protein